MAFFKEMTSKVKVIKMKPPKRIAKHKTAMRIGRNGKIYKTPETQKQFVKCEVGQTSNC